MKLFDKWLNRRNGAYFVTFQGKDDEWYWRLVSPNGQTIAVGGEGFASKSSARASTHGVVSYCRGRLRYLPPPTDETK